MKSKLLIILLVVVGVIGLGVYKLVHSFDEAGKLGDAEVAKIHERFNAGKDEEIYENTVKGFKDLTSLATLKQVNDNLRETLGKFKSTTRSGINMSNNNGNKALVLSYHSVFEKAERDGTFTFDYNGPAPILLGYDYSAKPAKPAPAP